MVDQFRTLSSREVYRDAWMTLRADDVEWPGGRRGTYAVVDRPDFVVVVPFADGGFWLVQEYRYPVGRRVWAFPQGGWPAGRSGTPAELAAAELREETGFRAAELLHLGHLFAAVGFSSQGYDVFLATELTAGAHDREPSEADMICEWRSEAEVRTMIATGELVDGHAVAALALFDQHRRT